MEQRRGDGQKREASTHIMKRRFHRRALWKLAEPFGLGDISLEVLSAADSNPESLSLACPPILGTHIISPSRAAR